MWIILWMSELYMSFYVKRLLTVDFNPRGVVAVYMTGTPTELHIANPKKYMNLKFFTQKNTWHQNFLPKKIQDLVPQY